MIFYKVILSFFMNHSVSFGVCADFPCLPCRGAEYRFLLIF